MNKFKKLGAVAVATVMTCASAFSIMACSPTTPEPEVPEEPVGKELIFPKTLEWDEQVKPTDWRVVEDTFTAKTSSKADGSTETYSVKYRTVENIVYCTNPTDTRTKTEPSIQQSLRFYAPDAYFNEDGTINTTATVNGYTAETAPIIYINNCSGYSGDVPWEISTIWRYGGANTKYYGWYYNYLNNGFVLCFAGERGKATYTADNKVIGTAPISLADLKAGLRFLHHNSGSFPGNTDMIISNGVSAGGNMSALLGVTGNSDIYDYWLEDMGAYMEDDADDSVFATQAYCPITDLDHAALAYEWMWQGDETTGALSDFMKAVSAKLAIAYADYINELELVDVENDNAPLTLGTDGLHNGTFYEWLLAQYEKSYTHYASVYGDKDSSTYPWLSYSAQDGAKITKLQDMFMQAYDDEGKLFYNPRQKGCITFDQTNLGGDNPVFGVPGAAKGSQEVGRHFTPDIIGIFDSLRDQYPEDVAKYYDSYKKDVETEEVLQMIYMYNPYHFITDESTVKSEHFRICVGTQDRDSSPTVSAVYALLLQKANYDVEYNLVWNAPHIDADMIGEFEAWVNSICKE